MSLATSELIINDDGSIYHLNLRPDQIAHTIILVGDPDRVPEVSKYFDHIDHKVGRREFHTHTGSLNRKKISVISTGIGTDNIDIVLNELDALVNVDFNTRSVKEVKTTLDFIRIGTSGAIQDDIPVDSFLISRHGIGFDSLFHWYENDGGDSAFAKAIQEQLQLSPQLSTPYVIAASSSLSQTFEDERLLKGNTVTNVGFYAPQGRNIRLEPSQNGLNDRMSSFTFKGHKITNLEMETAGIYAMAYLLGHRAVSLNAILANRVTGDFSSIPAKTVDQLIQFALQKLSLNKL